MIYYGKQNISEEDIQAVEAVMRSDFLTQGLTPQRYSYALDLAYHLYGIGELRPLLRRGCRFRRHR